MEATLENFVSEALKAGHSQKYIDECTKYIRTLDAKGYPIIFSIVHLAILLGMKSDWIVSFAEYRNTKYSYFKLKKRRGGFREIITPHEDLKFVQRWILINILSKYPLSSSCKGFCRGNSPVVNARVHQRRKYILKIDLLKFYDTITESRVFGVFKSMGYIPNLAWYLARLVTVKHRHSYWENFNEFEKRILRKLVIERPAILPQGAPTSPMMSNIIATRLDERLGGLAATYDCYYSRYADDLTFSSDTEDGFPDLKFIYHIIEDEGFFVNESKTSLAKRGRRQYVTGLTITHGVHVSKKYRRNISMHLYYSKKFGPTAHLEKWTNDQGFERSPFGFQDWLLGSIAHIASVDKVNGKKMLTQFNEIDWTN